MAKNIFLVLALICLVIMFYIMANDPGCAPKGYRCDFMQRLGYYSALYGIFFVPGIIFGALSIYFSKKTAKKNITENKSAKKSILESPKQRNNILSSISKNVKMNSKEQINVTHDEEEEIYVKVSREFSENKKEGMWTKALIQSDGDESKAKIAYMKLRVEQLTNDLLELKLEQQNEVLRKHEEALLSEQLDKPNLTTIKKLKLLIKQSKKTKIKGKELIPTEYIEFLAKKFNPKVHRTNSYIHMFKELNKLVENSKSNKIKGHELIPTGYIEQIVSEFESLFG